VWCVCGVCVCSIGIKLQNLCKLREHQRCQGRGLLRAGRPYGSDVCKQAESVLKKRVFSIFFSWPKNRPLEPGEGENRESMLSVLAVFL